MPLLPEAKNCDISIKKNFRKISAKLGYMAIPSFASITLTDLTASSLVGTNASKLLESVTVGTGLDYTRPTLSLSHLGIEDLTDPGADRILFWDDNTTACGWLAVGNSIAITTTTIDTIQDIRTSASPTFTGLTLSGLTQGSVVFAGAGGVISEDTTNLLWDDSTNILTANIFNALDEDNILQIDGITIFKTGTAANKNFFIGENAGATASGTSTGNISIGKDSLKNLTIGDQNVAIGERALENCTEGFQNFALGTLALANLTLGNSNVAIGRAAGNLITVGDNNVLIGRSAGQNIIIGISNVLIGAYTGQYITGELCIGIGKNALRGTSGLSSGWNNVAIGGNAGLILTTGGSNIFIGYQAGRRQTTNSNLLIIDNQDRGSAVADITDSILYGVMAATPAAQSLRINAEILGSDGAKIGDGGVTNYTKIETDGTIEFNGAATVWKDINIGAGTLSGPPGLQPGIVNFVDEVGADTGIATYGLAVGEGLSGLFEIQHDYKEGSDITFHVHWQGIAVPSGTDKVQFQLTYTITSEETAETLDAVTIITAESDFDTQYESITTSFTTITGTNLEIGDQFLFTLERIAASADEYGGEALLQTVGIHYEIDTVGSRTITAK